MWKKITLSMLAALCLFATGKLAYDRGYSRGKTDGAVYVATMYIDTPKEFLGQAEILCVLDMIDGYEILGLWQQSAKEAQEKLYKEAVKSCKQKVEEATVVLANSLQ
jgi:hypothetical protein